MTSGVPLHPLSRQEPPLLTGMADAVLAEIAESLAAAASSEASTRIELTAMPLTVADRADLEERLGRGEVVATIDSAGRSDVWETQFSGVWFVRHYGENDRPASECIEIGAVPAILRSHRADMAAAATRLAAVLQPRDAADQ